MAPLSVGSTPIRPASTTNSDYSSDSNGSPKLPPNTADTGQTVDGAGGNDEETILAIMSNIVWDSVQESAQMTEKVFGPSEDEE